MVVFSKYNSVNSYIFTVKISLKTNTYMQLLKFGLQLFFITTAAISDINGPICVK
nr:hypothetical protein [uncultured bacterium]